jgi:hypothetical protein
MTTRYGVHPECLALVVCETVIEDFRSRNKSLINMFNGILAPQTPVRHDRMCAFAAFTGGRGTVPISLRLVRDAAWDEDLMRLGGQVDFPPNDPNAVVDLVFEIRGFVFPEFGAYTFQLLAEEHILAMRRFNVSKPPEEPPPALG